MENSLDKSLSIAKKFVKEVLPFYDKDGNIDAHQLTTSLHPYISNAMYEHGKELLNKERMETLITLARTLDNETIEKVVNALKYQIFIVK